MRDTIGQPRVPEPAGLAHASDPLRSPTMVRRTLVLAYGLWAYAATLATFIYLAGFIGGILTPTKLDDPRKGSLAVALAINLGLLALFALQHSGMARPGFKRWLTRFVAQPIERSTYCLLSSVSLFLLFWLWQ